MNVNMFVTINQAMGILNISRPTIQRKLRAGEIPMVRFGKRILIPDEYFKQLSAKAMEHFPSKAG